MKGVRRLPVRRMNISINLEKTGKRIRELVRESGYSVRELMRMTGVTTEQAIYKWYRGKSLPSEEVQLVLCEILGVGLTEREMRGRVRMYQGMLGVG